MSYPGVDPVDEAEMNPVGTQEDSTGKANPLFNEQKEEGKTAVLELPNVIPTENLEQAVEKAVNNMFAVTDAWRPKPKVKFKINCPSGQIALVKHLDTLALLEFDLIEELDFFTRKLFPVDIDAAGNPVEATAAIEESIWAALKNPEKRCRFFNMTGKLMAAASIEPKIVHDGVAVVTVTDPETGESSKTTKFGFQMSVQEQIEHFKRPVLPLANDKSVYSGCIDFSDRMAFFQELNKPLELIEPFREESAAMLQDMARSEGNGGETK